MDFLGYSSTLVSTITGNLHGRAVPHMKASWSAKPAKYCFSDLDPYSV